MPTRREVIESLLHDDRWTARELQQHFRCLPGEIIDDLEHIKKSVLPKHRLIRQHAQCRDCGFVFRDRPKLKRPSKCPKCNSEAITEPVFWIE